MDVDEAQLSSDSNAAWVTFEKAFQKPSTSDASQMNVRWKIGEWSGAEIGLRPWQRVVANTQPLLINKSISLA